MGTYESWINQADQSYTIVNGKTLRTKLEVSVKEGLELIRRPSVFKQKISIGGKVFKLYFMGLNIKHSFTFFSMALEKGDFLMTEGEAIAFKVLMRSGLHTPTLVENR